jgi:hypothetical protein
MEDKYSWEGIRLGDSATTIQPITISHHHGLMGVGRRTGSNQMVDLFDLGCSDEGGRVGLVREIFWL